MFGVRNIKDGMIIINKLGDVGYVLSSGMSLITVDYGHEFANYPMSFFNDSDWVKETFKQIGTYKFDEVEKKVERKKIENLDLKENIMNSKLDTMTDFYIMSKLNEVIDRLNEIMER